jgi:hypothetical protein
VREGGHAVSCPAPPRAAGHTAHPDTSPSPPPMNSSMQEGTMPPTPLLSRDDDHDDNNDDNDALVSPLPPLPSLESGRNRRGGGSDGMGAVEGGGVVVKSIFLCACVEEKSCVHVKNHS